jgi:hexosaminidase
LKRVIYFLFTRFQYFIQLNNKEIELMESAFSHQPHRDSSDSRQTLIPTPTSMISGIGSFILTDITNIFIDPHNDEIKFIGEYLACKLRAATGFPLVVLQQNGSMGTGYIQLFLKDDPGLEEEGYILEISSEKIILSARNPAGLFWGAQTLRQLLPPRIESSSVQSGPWEIPSCTIRDHPRFPWRGVMLDVCRHFFNVEDVKYFIDLLVYYKMNRLHLHLSDDQGWRLVIDKWPRLAEYGGSKEVGGGEGGYYSKAQYAEIATYAQNRYITVVPEIDMPGHTNAALASYPELNCNGLAPDLYTGTEVGFSSLCVGKEVTFTFLEDVIREIGEITPGPYFHIGGDEAAATSQDDYKTLMERVQSIVHKNGKKAVGWEEISQVKLHPDTIAQYWSSGHARKAAEQGNKVIMSPASKIYLDMKYTPKTHLGLTWAGLVEVSDSYNWDPSKQLPGVSEGDILGVEAPLWTETIETLEAIEYMVFPRLLGVAEIGWSSEKARGWEEYKVRLGAHGPRLKAMAVNFYASPEVPWEE